VGALALRLVVHARASSAIAVRALAACRLCCCDRLATSESSSVRVVLVGSLALSVGGASSKSVASLILRPSRVPSCALPRVSRRAVRHDAGGASYARCRLLRACQLVPSSATDSAFLVVPPLSASQELALAASRPSCSHLAGSRSLHPLGEGFASSIVSSSCLLDAVRRSGLLVEVVESIFAVSVSG